MADGRGGERRFRQEFIDILEAAVIARIGDRPGPIGVSPTDTFGLMFHFCEEVVLFPDRSGRLPGGRTLDDLRLSSKRYSVPVAVVPSGVVEDGARLQYTRTKAEIPLPELPLESGFVHQRGVLGFPTEVRDYPSERLGGSYYWVRPTGIRNVAHGMRTHIGEAKLPTPIHVGLALWWGEGERTPMRTAPRRSSPLVAAVFARKVDG